MSAGFSHPEPAETVALTHKISAWTRSAGLSHVHVSVDLADIVAAASYAEQALQEMLALDVNDPAQAAEALDRLGQIHAWLFTELKVHLEQLEQKWPDLEERLAALAPSDEE